MGGVAFGGRDVVGALVASYATALTPQLRRRGAVWYHICSSRVRGSSKAMLTLVIRVYRLGGITPFCSPSGLRLGPKSCLASRPAGTFLRGSVGVWLLATVLQDPSGVGASQVSAFVASTWGVLSSSRGLHVAVFGGLLARSRPWRTISWGTRWGQ